MKAVFKSSWRWLTVIALALLALKARSLVVLAPYSAPVFFSGLATQPSPDSPVGSLACTWNQGFFYVSNSVDGYLYTADAGGGVADAAHRVGGACMVWTPC